MDKSSDPPDQILILYKDEKGDFYRLVKQKIDPPAEVRSRTDEEQTFRARLNQLTERLKSESFPENTLVAIDKHLRAFRLGMFDGNGTDGARPQTRLPDLD